MKVVVICADDLPLDAYSFLREKLDKIIGPVRKLKLATRAKDVQVHRYAFERRLVYQKFTSKESLESLLAKAKALVAFSGEKLDPAVEGITSLAEEKGMKVRKLRCTIPY